MPAMTIVILTDDDGDEFPIGFTGNYNPNPQEDRWLQEHALERAATFIESGDWNPKGELKFERIEGN